MQQLYRNDNANSVQSFNQSKKLDQTVSVQSFLVAQTADLNSVDAFESAIDELENELKNQHTEFDATSNKLVTSQQVAISN